MTATAAVVLTGCGEDERSNDSEHAAAAECTSTVRFEGTIYTGLISQAKDVPTGGKLGVADVAACDDIGRQPVGSYFPPNPDQVEVWALNGYLASEVIGVQKGEALDAYAVEDMPRARADAITDELIDPVGS